MVASILLHRTDAEKGTRLIHTHVLIHILSSDLILWLSAESEYFQAHRLSSSLRRRGWIRMPQPF
jgi:hypothetical protein